MSNDVFVRLKLNSAEFDTSLADSTKKVQKFDGEIKEANKTVKKSETSIAGMTGALTALSVGAGAVAFAIIKVNSAMADGVFEADRYANRLGLSTKAILNLQSAGKDFGVEAEDISEGLKNMTERLGEAFLEGRGATFDGLTKLGVDLEHIESLNTEDRFFALAGALSEVESEAERTFLTMEIFQEEGFKMAEMLDLGEKGLRDYVKSQDKYTDSLNIEALREYRKEMSLLGKSTEVLSRNLGLLSVGEYASGLNFLIEGMNEWIAGDFKGELFGEDGITVSGFSRADALEAQLQIINKKTRAEEAYQAQLKKNQEEQLKGNKISADALIKEQKLRAEALNPFSGSSGKANDVYKRTGLDELLKSFRLEDSAPDLLSTEMQTGTLGLLERGSAEEIGVRKGTENELQKERNELLKKILAENKKRQRAFQVTNVGIQ